MKAFYSATLSQFINESSDSIIGKLTSKASSAGFQQQLHSQTRSWEDEVVILKSAISTLFEKKVINNGGILLEYPIPRREKRIDCVVITNGILIVIEFKSGKFEYQSSDKDQLLDYCLDLRDFHFESRNKKIIPLLLASNAKAVNNSFDVSLDEVQEIVYANALTLADNLSKALMKYQGSELNYSKWENSIYSPTPTIIEAARTLYVGKSVTEITNNHAGNNNLIRTSQAVVNAIKDAKLRHEKIICFIAGVPGAGKTLAGLNIAHDDAFQTEGQSLATFLSGNGPLIRVLRKALSKDALERIRKDDVTIKMREAKKVEAFIENVHRFLDEYFFDKNKTPNNKIVIFDEAQRAWNAEHSMRKFQRNFSEPEMMLSIMNRHPDWSVIVALVGGGQEINTGEAGLPEWGSVLTKKFNDWKSIYISRT